MFYVYLEHILDNCQEFRIIWSFLLIIFFDGVSVYQAFTSFKLAFPFMLCVNRIGGVMVSVLASSAVDRGFESQSGIKLVFAASSLSTQRQRERAKTESRHNPVGN